MQVYGANYFETFAPDVTLFALHVMIVSAIFQTSLMRQMDFTQVYVQAPIGANVWYQDKAWNSMDYVLKPMAYLYGKKQAGCIRNQFMVDKL